ncbi:MAG TPA: DUF2884 family protein [Burkholderiales bacterium]|nr:DUF2884 family protein [Burkholderiales bacterium]
MERNACRSIETSVSHSDRLIGRQPGCRRWRVACLALLAPGVVVPAYAGDLDAACRVRSDYDITVTGTSLVFERTTAPVRRFEMRSGSLTMNGKPVALGPADRDRIVRFERTARALVAPVKALGQRAVDLSADAVREEAALSSPQSAKNPRLNTRLAARTTDLKMRIARSDTSKEWRGAALNRYAAQTIADVLPLIGSDLAAQALEIALRGDLAGARALGERAAGLRTSLERRIRGKLDALEPDVKRLCPSLRTLDRLESGVTARLPDGSRLNLIEVGR